MPLPVNAGPPLHFREVPVDHPGPFAERVAPVTRGSAAAMGRLPAPPFAYEKVALNLRGTPLHGPP